MNRLRPVGSQMCTFFESTVIFNEGSATASGAKATAKSVGALVPFVEWQCQCNWHESTAEFCRRVTPDFSGGWKR